MGKGRADCSFISRALYLKKSVDSLIQAGEMRHVGPEEELGLDGEPVAVRVEAQREEDPRRRDHTWVHQVAHAEPEAQGMG